MEDTKVKQGVKYSVPALDKAVAILEMLAQAKDGASFGEIIKELQLPKTSVYTILNTLEGYGLVRKRSDNAYDLGLKLYSLGMTALRKINVDTSIVPYLEKLRDSTHFTVHLCAYENGETVLLEKIEGPGMVRFQSIVGERKRMNTTGCGKAAAAYLGEEDLELMFSKGLNCFTANSISTEPAFRAHLNQIREFGYAIDDEEGEIGVRCIGVPLFMSDARVFGSISLTTIKSNLSLQQVPEYAEQLIAVGGDISRLLGYKGEYPRHRG
jgi:DNA-binding IclR family transcriptional regulator